MSLLLIGLLLWLPAETPQGLEGYPRADLLAEPDSLARPDALGKHVVVDTRPKAAYQAGHIPGAVWVDHHDWEKTFAATQDPQVWHKRISGLGIGNGGHVVVYGGPTDSARIWWILHYWGLKDIRLLNGGWKAWTDSGREVTRKTTQPAPAAVLTLQAAKDRLATKGQLLDALPKKDLQILDARTEGEYCGTVKLSNRRGGAIPGAMHLEWKAALDPRTQRFKSPAELRKLLKDRDIDVGKRTVTYCQSGGRAALLAFTIELMGGREVGNYYRSWSEWGNDPTTPVVQPKKQ